MGADIISISDYDRAFTEAKRALVSGKLVVYPTDTLYGIGANAFDDGALELLRGLKGERGDKPISVILPTLFDVKKYCELDEKTSDILCNMLPGPYTVILKSKGALPKAIAPHGTVGARVPKFYFTLKLAGACGFPITSTSANASGKAPPASISEISKEILDACAVVVDAGKCACAQGSTVIDFTKKPPLILRQGAGKFPI
jgi:L-threonylcarbamoyladenylate synthase